MQQAHPQRFSAVSVSRRLFFSAPGLLCRAAAARGSRAPCIPISGAPANQHSGLAWTCPNSLLSKRQNLHLSFVPQAAALDSTESIDNDLEASNSGAAEHEELDLPMPDARHQRQLDMKAIKALRTRANTAAKDKTLINVQVKMYTTLIKALRHDVFLVQHIAKSYDTVLAGWAAWHYTGSTIYLC